MRNDHELIPAVAVHPGEIIAMEIEERGWSQKELARRMRRPYPAVNEIVRGHKRITAETALDLAEATGIAARFWLDLQTNHDLNQARMRRRKAPDQRSLKHRLRWRHLKSDPARQISKVG